MPRRIAGASRKANTACSSADLLSILRWKAASAADHVSRGIVQDGAQNCDGREVKLNESNYPLPAIGKIAWRNPGNLLLGSAGLALAAALLSPAAVAQPAATRSEGFDTPDLAEPGQIALRPPILGAAAEQ